MGEKPWYYNILAKKKACILGGRILKLELSRNQLKIQTAAQARKVFLMSDYNEISAEIQEETATVRAYEQKKEKNFNFLPFMLGKASVKMLERIDSCGQNLLFAANEEKSKHRLYKGYFCGNRWCPYCGWRKARRDAVKLSVLMTAIKDIYRYEFLFVTLTTPNVPAEKLESEIRHFNQSFLKMMKRKKFRGWGEKRSGEAYKGFVKGYMKKVEVTYNRDRDDFNPHLHVLIAVNKSYFKKNYLSKAEWLDVWRDVTGQPEITQVDVKRVKTDEKDNAVQEMAKYAAKDSEYLLNQEVFDTFFASLKHKRTVNYAGIFKDFAKRYEEDELDEYKILDNEHYVWILMAKFNYDSMTYERKYRIMTANEKNDLYDYVDGDECTDEQTINS